MDQRAFGPRQLMVAFAAYDGEFLGLLYTTRRDPFDGALDACLRHFEVEGLGRHADGVAAVVLCDQRVVDSSCRPHLEAMLERARTIAARHDVHLVDWIACDDDTFCAARLQSLDPASDPDWWDVPRHAAS